ncbi:MAG: methylenetetrahydrofolate--tRNA-(uracil(54)-C(5))-methyltransferase (FADH(2)-oxidizing) TrmFO [Acidobacteriaceae bacterium]
MSDSPSNSVKVLGAGLAGSEAALTLARFGVDVDLYEMRPVKMTPAHQTGDFGELVCSNSLKSESPNTAPWLLKQEMRRAGSALLRCADQSAVPAGHALAVDRVLFSANIKAAIEAEPRITLHREEVTHIDEANGLTIVATGPLTSDALSADIPRLTGSAHLAFYDSISPIVEKDSIDFSRVYYAARWDKGTADYINCPFTKEEYDRFLDALIAGEPADAHEWERLNYFEGCLPIEVTARRGRDTLRFGPMKPVGLRDPRTGKIPHAVVQLRSENLRADSYNLVGFQNHLKWSDQARVLRLIPGLENAKFLRYGQIHRNTYLNAPTQLAETLQLRRQPNLFFAGQICGVEGYTESIAAGLLAAIYAVHLARNTDKNVCATASLDGFGDICGTDTPLHLGDVCNTDIPVCVAPRSTALGSLIHYITHADAKNFQPANITFDLLPQLPEEVRRKVRDKKERHRLVCESALAAFDQWWRTSSQTILAGREEW